MKRLFLILSAAALVLPATALGKGPTSASFNGPGLAGPITFKGYETGRKSVGTLAEQAGFFPAAFGQQPGPMLVRRPQGNLGPKYTITYTVRGAPIKPDRIRQDLYPYASPRPVTYMKPGQRLFGGSRLTHGGWFRAGPGMKNTLVRAGLPPRPPSATSAGGSLPTLTAGGLGLLVVLSAIAVLVRRQARPAARMARSPG